MLGNDPVHVLRRHVVVPDAVRLHTQHRSTPAGGETVHPGAFDTQRALIQPCRLELLPEAVKQLLGLAFLGTPWSDANQEMTAIVTDFRLLDAHCSNARIFV